jgi:hypothetical protein
MAADDLLGAHRHLRVDTVALQPHAAADLVVAWLASH